MLAQVARRARASASICRVLAASRPFSSAPPTPPPVVQQNQRQNDGIDLSEPVPEFSIRQAPNRTEIWSPNQEPRSEAMTGPRFEQMNIQDQPQPWAAIELIHKVPVRWSSQRVVSCDGGGGPLGHPRIFINLDKPKIAACTYCGTPFAHEHHRKFLASLPSNPYPLE